jgi:hypothetical protein
MSLCPQCGTVLQADEHECAMCQQGTTTTPEDYAINAPTVEEEETSARAVEPDFEMTTTRWNFWRRIGYFLGYGGTAFWALVLIINRPDRASIGESILIVVVGGTIFSFLIAVAGSVCAVSIGDFRDVIPFLRPPRDNKTFKTMDDWKTVKKWGAEDDSEDEFPSAREETSPDGIQKDQLEPRDENYHSDGEKP